MFIIPSGISVFREEKDLTEMEKLLEKVAFAEGPADDEILAYLQGGWTDIPALQQKLSGTTRLYEATLARAELDEAYAKLRANFTINADELEAAFSSVCEAKAELLPPRIFDERRFHTLQARKERSLAAMVGKMEKR